MDTNEINRLAEMAATLRPDWPAKSLRTFLAKRFEGRAYGDVAVALAWICTRTKTDTPRLLEEAGPWWKATATEGATGARPPKRDEACATCGRRETEHVGLVIGDHPFVPLDHATKAKADPTTHLARVRAEIRRAGTETAQEGIE